MIAPPFPRPRFLDLFISFAFCVITFAVSTILYLRHHEAYITDDFYLYLDQGVNLYLADLLAKGGVLYRDAQYPYGPVPVYLYTGAAMLFGNSCDTYFGFQRLIGAANGGLLFFVLRWVGIGRGRAAVGTLVAIPYLLVPGAILGDYTTAAYIQLERCYLTLLPVIFLMAAGKTRRGAATVGLYLAGFQLLKFGGCYFAGAAMVGLDLARSAADREGRAGLLAAAKFWLTAAAWYCAGEAVRWLVAFTMLPGPVAWDVVWPAYAGRAYASMPFEWKVIGITMKSMARKLVPAVGMIVAMVVAISAVVTGRRRAVGSFALCTFAAFYAIGSAKYFGHAYIYLQYVWLPVAAVAALFSATGRAGRFVAIALVVASWAVLAGVDVAMSRQRPIGTWEEMPNGDILFMRGGRPSLPDQLTKMFIAKYGKPSPPGRMLIVPIGAGYHFYFHTTPFSRDLWYIPAYIRPYDETVLLQAAAETSVVVGPAEDALAWCDKVFPPAVATSLRSRAEPPVRLNGWAVIFLSPAPK